MNMPDDRRLNRLLTLLYSRINFEAQDRARATDFNLVPMRQFLSQLGNPHLNYSAIHVAGTKGKGSVCAMVGAALREAGLRVGIYTSPHLERINQRICVDDQLISDRDLGDILEELEPQIARFEQDRGEGDVNALTFFEIITAAAFVHFSNRHVDAAVLEVGMGGRLDSTNVCQPTIAVVTNISLDHTRQLGSTVDRIAKEKAGIIKRKVPAVSGIRDSTAANVVREVAHQHLAPLYELGRDFSLVPPAENGSFAVNGWWPGGTLDGLTTRMLGYHQKTNAAIVVAVCKVLQSLGWSLSDDHIRSGIADVHLPGRTEILATDPIVLVDMAHNVASIQALSATLQSELNTAWKSKRRRLIFAVSSEKDAAGMLNSIIDDFDEIILTRYQINPRGKPVDELASVARKVAAAKSRNAQPTFITFPTAAQSWDYVVATVAPDQFVCVAGSAFLVAELRPVIRHWAAK
jgi:dihydrofolate synthase/folylpolyglutamate synthase